jgi:hypothetical protein
MATHDRDGRSARRETHEKIHGREFGIEQRSPRDVEKTEGTIATISCHARAWPLRAIFKRFPLFMQVDRTPARYNALDSHGGSSCLHRNVNSLLRPPSLPPPPPALSRDRVIEISASNGRNVSHRTPATISGRCVTRVEATVLRRCHYSPS